MVSGNVDEPDSSRISRFYSINTILDLLPCSTRYVSNFRTWAYGYLGVKEVAKLPSPHPMLKVESALRSTIQCLEAGSFLDKPDRRGEVASKNVSW